MTHVAYVPTDAEVREVTLQGKLTHLDAAYFLGEQHPLVAIIVSRSIAIVANLYASGPANEVANFILQGKNTRIEKICGNCIICNINALADDIVKV